MIHTALAHKNQCFDAPLRWRPVARVALAWHTCVACKAILSNGCTGENTRGISQCCGGHAEENKAGQGSAWYRRAWCWFWDICLCSDCDDSGISLSLQGMKEWSRDVVALLVRDVAADSMREIHGKRPGPGPHWNHITGPGSNVGTDLFKVVPR